MSDLDDDLNSFFDEPVKKKEEAPKAEKPKEEPKKEEPKAEEIEQVKKSDKKEEPKPEPKPEEPKIPKYKDDEEFDTSPDTSSEKSGVVITIYGKKGEGKTHLAFTLPGTHSCISFDRKSQRIAMKPEFENRITVYDGIKYYDRTDANIWLESSSKSWKFIQKTLDRIESIDRPDWIDIDGGEIVHQMFEMVMRNRNDIRAFQGIANKNIWKYRRMLIGQLLSRCQEVAKLGVVWTSYIVQDKIMKDGDYVSIEDIPKWIDAVLYETDSLIRVYRRTGKDGQQFLACVESSKWDALKNGPKIDVTDKGMRKLLSKDYLEKMGE